MNWRKFGSALLVVMALCGIVASSAYAENEFNESGSAVYVEGIKLVGSKVLVTEGVASGTLTTTIAGTPIKTEATGFKCVKCTIENSGTNAVGHGRLEATGVHIVEPAGCEDGPTIISNQVTATLGMNKAGTKATIRFAPTSGSTFEIAEISGVLCPVAGTYKVTGTVFAEVVNATGVFAKSQELKLSQAIQESAGTASSLKFGLNSAFATGTSKGSLEGVSEWAGKEK